MSIKKNAAWNIFGSGSPLIIALFAIPWLIKELGNEGFGVLSLIWSLVGYFSLFDLGIGRALTYKLSQNNLSDLKISSTIKTGILLTMILGFIGAGAIFLLLAPTAFNLFGIKNANPNDIKLAFQVTAIAIIPSTVTSGIRGALEGLNNFKESNIIKFYIGIVTFSAPVLSIIFLKSEINNLIATSIGLTTGRLIICCYAILKINFKTKNSFYLSFYETKQLLSYGAWATVSGIISPLMVYGDRLFVSSAIGASLLPLYSIPQEGLQRLLILPAAISSALLPRFVSTISHIEIKTIYYSFLKKIAITMIFICILSTIFTPIILGTLISSEFAKSSEKIIFILSIGIWFNSIAQVPYSLLNAKGAPKIVASIHFSELIIYMILVYTLSINFGLIGAAIAWSLRAALDFVLLHFFSKKFFISNLI